MDSLDQPRVVIDADLLCTDPPAVVAEWCERIGPAVRRGTPSPGSPACAPSGSSGATGTPPPRRAHRFPASSSRRHRRPVPTSHACTRPTPVSPAGVRATRGPLARRRAAAPRGSSGVDRPSDYARRMAPAPDNVRLAVLIDGDNTTPLIIEALLAEIAKYGSATVKRAYGDWTTPNLKGRKEAINTHAIQPMQQFAYTTGKNATDSALIIDAMDLLYTGNLDGSCRRPPTATSPSSRPGCASRARPSAPASASRRRRSRWWRRATSSSTSTCCAARPEARAGADQRAQPRPPSAPARRRAARTCAATPSSVKLLREGIDAASDDDGWAHLGPRSGTLRRQAGARTSTRATGDTPSRSAPRWPPRVFEVLGGRPARRCRCGRSPRARPRRARARAEREARARAARARPPRSRPRRPPPTPSS